MTKVNSVDGNGTKSDIFFHETYSNLTSYISLSKNVEAFHDFQNQNFSVL